MDLKYRIINDLHVSYNNEFNLNKPLKLQLDKKFRMYRNNINEILNPQDVKGVHLDSIWELLNKRSNAMKNNISSIKSKLTEDQLVSIIKSHIHMIVNRLFRSKQRIHELVIYYFLDKYYKSEIGRLKALKI